jgi:hypothetical protein
MPTVNDQIRDRVEAFAMELTELIRAAAMETVSAALGEGTSGGGRGGRGRGRRAAAAAPARATRGPGRPARAASREKGAKRPPQEIEKLTDRLADYIKSNPGQRIEQVAQGMGTSTKELNLPVKKLISTKAIKTKGQKRATQYFPR